MREEGWGSQFRGCNLEYWSGFAISMAPGGPLFLTCWSTLDLRSIMHCCSLSFFFLSPSFLSFSSLHTYYDTPTQTCNHTYQYTPTHAQLLIQAQEETELDLKKQSGPAERTIHHDLCVSEVCVWVCVGLVGCRVRRGWLQRTSHWPVVHTQTQSNT